MFDPMYNIILSRASLIPLDNTLGAWFIGLIVSSVLFGVTSLQVYLYFTKHCSRDAVFLKSFRAYSLKVALLMALDTLHLALLSHSFYSTTVTNFGDYVELGQAPWSLLVEVVVGGMNVSGRMVTHFLNFLLVFLATLVQFFYAFRIYTISNKTLVFPVIIGIFSLGQLDEQLLALGIAYTHKAFFKDAKADVPYSTSGLAFEVACDVLIAGAMIYHLLRNKSGFQKTNKAIHLLAAYSLNSGALTSVFAICDLVTFIVLPSTLVYAPFFFILVRFYGLSFMSILNSRDHVREELFSTSHAMITIPSYNANPTSTANTENGTNFGMTGKEGSHGF
ncbi:hypothetical protein B0H13DRAFT_1859508 [Mycena leptocephala]|nr:hypothetical protein B0H13DRAFT_1859508 [Mycena leptocephala]